MLRTDRLVITEGKYDKIKLESVLDAIILTTDGFSIFKDKHKAAFIKEYAKKHGILIITDSDAAGFKIRHFIMSIVPSEYILNAYIPDILGKEKRKTKVSGEGKIGVEGIDEAVLISALKDAGIENNKVAENHTLSYDLFEKGIIGTTGSQKKRRRLIAALGLPERVSNHTLLQFINRNYTKADFLKILESLEEENVQSIGKTD